MENPPFEDVFPIQDGDFPASYVCLPEGNRKCHSWYHCSRFFEYGTLTLDFFSEKRNSSRAQRNEVMFIDLFLGFVTSDGRRFSNVEKRDVLKALDVPFQRVKCCI